MGFFRKDRSRLDHQSLSPAPEDLARIGYAAYGGDNLFPVGFQLSELDQFVMHAMETAGYPAPGTGHYQQLLEQFLEQLARAGDRTPPWGVVGAFGVAINFTTDADRRHPVFLDLMDRALITVRDDGVAYPAVPPFALERWIEVYGYGGAAPAHWPLALESVVVPEVGHGPATVDLTCDERREIARDGPGSEARTTYAHRRSDGRVVAVIEGIDLSNGVWTQWELGVEADDYTSFLRALGDRLVTAPYWAHEDLRPYFPCRQRTRDDLRTAARTT